MLHGPRDDCMQGIGMSSILPGKGLWSIWQELLLVTPVDLSSRGTGAGRPQEAVGDVIGAVLFSTSNVADRIADGGFNLAQTPLVTGQARESIPTLGRWRFSKSGRRGMDRIYWQFSDQDLHEAMAQYTCWLEEQFTQVQATGPQEGVSA